MDLILKVTTGCNSRCRYCLQGQPREDGRAMSDEVLEAVYARVDEYLRRHPEEKAGILWHGGEPLLAGEAFYRKALAGKEAMNPDTSPRLTHSVQTNLTLLDRPLLEALLRLGITSVGTSFDPCPDLRGPGDREGGLRHLRRFFEAMELLAEAGLPWNLNYVVTSRSLKDPEGIFHYLTNLAAGASVTLNPVIVDGDDPFDLAVTPAQYADFLGRLLPLWWGRRERLCPVHPFTGLAERLGNGAPMRDCLDFGACGGSSDRLEIDVEGNILQSGAPVGPDLPRYGDVFSTTIDEALENEARDRYEEAVVGMRSRNCGTCTLGDICFDGWGKDLPAGSHRTYMMHGPWCEARQKFMWDHFLPLVGAAAPGVRMT